DGGSRGGAGLARREKFTGLWIELIDRAAEGGGVDLPLGHDGRGLYVAVDPPLPQDFPGLQVEGRQHVAGRWVAAGGVRRVNAAVGDGGRARQRVAEPERPHLLAGVRVDHEERARLGVESAAARVAGGRGRSVVVQVETPDELAGLGVDRIELLGMKASRGEDLAVVDGRRGDWGTARQGDLEATGLGLEGILTQLARGHVARAELGRRLGVGSGLPVPGLLEDVLTQWRGCEWGPHVGGDDIAGFFAWFRSRQCCSPALAGAGWITLETTPAGCSGCWRSRLRT